MNKAKLIDLAKASAIAIAAVAAAEALGIMGKVRTLFGQARTAIMGGGESA